MENSYEFIGYGGRVDEVYGLNGYENIYYNAPPEPSYNWSDFYYCQTDLVYDPAFYVMPSYQVYCPVIPVAYSADSYIQTYVPVHSGYYMPVYYQPSNLYYVNDIYPGQVYESPLVSSSAEQNSLNYEKQDSDLYNTAFGFSEKPNKSFTGGVGEVMTTCYLYYEEGPEKMNDNPNDVEENTNSSNNTVSNDVDSTTPDNNENTAVQLDEGGQPSSTNTNICVEDDVTFLKSLSAADFMEIKADIDGTYNHLKENLYNDVTKGYTKMKEFLRNVKWKWDRCLYTIREEEKVKKSFDMDFEYYFHDVIRIPKGRVRYEDAAEKYILYQMLGSLEIPLLKEFMELNYDKHKKRIYKKECKGHTKIKKQLKKLKWKRSKLYPITDGEELKITEKGFVKNFIRGLRNITSEKSKDVNYLLDVLKKSVLTSADMTDEEAEEDVNEDGTPPDSELVIEHPQLSVFSTDSAESDVSATPYVSISKGEHDVEKEMIIEVAVSSPYVAHDSQNDPVPHETELPFCKEDFETEKIEDTQTSVFSSEKLENDVTNTHMSKSKGEHYVEKEKIIEDLQPVESTSCVAEYSKTDPVPDEIELPFCKEDYGTEKIEDTQTSTVSEEKRGENERPFAPPVIEMDSVSYDSFGKEDLSPVCIKRIEESHLDVSSPDRKEEKRIHPSPVISEPTVLAAAAENCHQKKRFSSLRKFLSRICCCRKKPPS